MSEFLKTWGSPEGIKTLIQFILVAMAGVTAILSLIGQKAKAAEVADAKDKLEASTVKSAGFEAQVANASKVVVGIVQGVEAFRSKAPDEHGDALKTEIMAATKALGIEDVVRPVVKAITEGEGSISVSLLSAVPAVAVDAKAQPKP